MTVRSPLRQLTRSSHDAVDALFSRFDLADRRYYAAFLAAQAPAVVAIEAALDAADADAVIPQWQERRRGGLICADLAELGEVIPPPVPAPIINAVPAILGAAYVLEGSRLGGAMLATRVGHGFPVRFLEAPAAPGAWRNLLILLQKQLETKAALDAAAETATACFQCFEVAAKRNLESLGA